MPKVEQVDAHTSAVPYWQTSDGETVRLYHGDVLSVLPKLSPKSVQMVVTSPPYWGLRDYGADKLLEIGAESLPDCLGWALAAITGEQLDPCGRCFVCKLVEVFRGLWRVLRDDGTVWLNLGDTYSGSSGTGGTNSATVGNGVGQSSNAGSFHGRILSGGIDSGNLVGVPWRVALALQADGWILRQDVIWAKPSPMPESVRNRCTKSHEYVFLLTKNTDYFCDMEAIKEPQSKAGADVRSKTSTFKKQHLIGNQIGGSDTVVTIDKNKRSVWWVASFGYPGAHFATYPPKLVEPCVLAGTSEKGCCPECRTPWQRIVDSIRLATRPGDTTKVKVPSGWNTKPGSHGGRNRDGRMLEPEYRTVGGTADNDDTDGAGNAVGGDDVRSRDETGNRDPGRHVTEYTTIGWRPDCGCGGVPVISDPPSKPVQRKKETDADYESRLDSKWRPAMVRWKRMWANVKPQYEMLMADNVPCVVMDSFLGSGTTAEVCLKHGRRFVGIELSEKYLVDNAIPRIEGEILSRPALEHLLTSSGGDGRSSSISLQSLKPIGKKLKQRGT